MCESCGTTQPLHPLEIPLLAFYLARRHPDIVCLLTLFLATALTIYPLFTGDFPAYYVSPGVFNWVSIESAYMSDAIFLSNNFPNAGWFPYWYGGLPFSVTYPPLFIYAMAIVHFITGLSVTHSYRVLVAVAYSCTPPAVYLLAKNLTKRSLASLFAGLTYSFVPNFITLPYSFAPSHIGTLTYYGEGPQFFSIVFELLALLQLIRCMKEPTWFKCLTTSVLIAVVALTDVVPLYSLGILMIAAVTVEAFYRNDRGILAFSVSAVSAWGLVAFQYDLQFIQQYAVQPNEANAMTYAGISLLMLSIVILLVRQYFSRFLIAHGDAKAWIFIGFWLLLMGLLLAPVWIPLPQLAPIPHRYVPEFDIGLSLLIGLILSEIDIRTLKLPNTPRGIFPRPRIKWVLAGFLILLTINVLFLLPVSWKATAPTIFLENIPEYRVATWLSQHVTDESIFASGAAAFWLNVFTDVRQIRGGLDEGATNSWWAAVSYQILAGANPAVSVLWAQAWNVKYIVVTFRNASMYPLDYSYPNKFNGLLPLRYYFGGYGIYEVPLSHSGIVEAVSAESAENISPITDVLDLPDVGAFDQLSQGNPNSTATVTYTIPNSDIIQVAVQHATYDTAILVKITYDTRWAAEVGGEPVQISQIGPDFMVAYPRIAGNYHLTFNLHSSDGETLGTIETITAIIALAGISGERIHARRRKASTHPKENDIDQHAITFSRSNTEN